MAEKFVTVATYCFAHEAQLAAGKLEEEGIRAYLTGDTTVNAFSGFQGLAGKVQVQVEEGHLSRAQEILVGLRQDEELDDSWQTQVEQDPSVWVCSLCGEPNADDREVCPSCKTERQSVVERPRAGRRRSPVASTSDKVERRNDVRTEGPEAVPNLESPEDLDVPPVETFLGDDLARRAFLSALFGCLIFFGGWSFHNIWPLSGFFVPFTAYSIWLLVRLLLFSGELSGPGIRRMCLAIALNLVTVFFASFLHPWILFVVRWMYRIF